MLDIKFFNWGTGKLTLKSKQNNMVHRGNATDLQRSVERENHYTLGILSSICPKDIQMEISYINVMHSLSEKDLGKKKLAIKFPQYKS